jgi:TatA/E family protein of Tat protein translocase
MLSIPHLIVIFVVALVVFGPEKIPELARNLGKIMAEFRRVTGDLRSTFEGHLRDLEREADTRRIATTPLPTAVTAVPAAAAAPVADPSPAPGTVASNPPNAAAVADKPGAKPEASVNNSVPAPGDLMHDPYLMRMDFPAPDSAAEPSDSENKTERVTDGDRRVS